MFKILGQDASIHIAYCVWTINVENVFNVLFMFWTFYLLLAKNFISTKRSKLLHKTNFKWRISHGSYRKFSDDEP